MGIMAMHNTNFVSTMSLHTNFSMYDVSCTKGSLSHSPRIHGLESADRAQLDFCQCYYGSGRYEVLLAFAVGGMDTGYGESLFRAGRSVNLG